MVAAMRIRTLAGALLAVLKLGSPAAADEFDAVRAKIQTGLDQERVASLSVAVAKDGKILWEEGFGWADRERKVQATPHTVYSLASISKPITATGLMILVEQARVELDQPVNDYLGEAKLKGLAGDAAGATVAAVASHTAGLPLHYQFFLEGENYPRPSMDETLKHYGILVTKPGEKYQYSNLGYGILDYVIERKSGKAYPAFMREQVFQPLGMEHTSIPVAGAELDSKREWAVRYWNSDTPLPFYDFDHRGGSAVYACAHDLVRFGMFHLGQKSKGQKAILKASSISRMQQPIARASATSRYGLGWA
jgi:CubicO group peptidase (beta-lactamase class C family)